MKFLCGFHFGSVPVAMALAVAGAFSALGADDAATPNAPDLRELWVPSNDLKAVLDKMPRAVLLTREQYARLLQDAKKNFSPEKEPPARAVLTAARYTGKLKGDVVDVQAEFTVNVLSDKWADVPLRLESLSMGEIKLDGDEAVFITRQGAKKLIIRGKGEHKITAEFMVAVTSESGCSALQLSLPETGASLFTLNLPPNMRVESSSPVEVQTGDAGTTAKFAPGKENSVEVTWRGAGESQQGQAILFQENSYIYTIDEVKVEADLGIVINAALGNLPESAQITIPAGSTPLQVTGDEVLKWTANGNVLTVDLTPGDRKTVGIRVLLETPMAADLTKVAAGANTPSVDAVLPLPQVAGVRRAAGKFAVIGSRGVKVREITAGQGVVQEEGVFQGSIEQNPHFAAAYGFAKQPKSITARIEKVHPQFSANLDTMVELKREAVLVERTLTLNGEEGEIFETHFTMPQGEELLSVSDGNGLEPDWKKEGGGVGIRWSDGMGEGQQRVFKIKSRMEPAKWPEVDALALGDLKIAGAEKVNGYIALSADKMLRVETAVAEGLEQRDGRTTPVRGDFAWFRRETFRLEMNLAPREPEVQATLVGYVLPQAGALEVHGQLNYSILYSGVNKLRVKVPKTLDGFEHPPEIKNTQKNVRPLHFVGWDKTAEQFYFDGAQIAERNRDGDTWTIVLQKEVVGDYTLKFRAVIPFKETDSNFTVGIPDVQPLDAKQAAGTWAVEANTSTEISFNANGLNELDPLHAPALADYQPRHHVIGVYGYLGGDHSLMLEGVKHAAAAMPTTVADRLDLETVVSTSGAERHQATFYIRSAGDQFLEVTLPEGATVWSLAVDEEPMKPVSEKAGVLRVQLPATLDRMRAVKIGLIYETRGREWGASGGRKLAAPRLEERIPVLHSTWNVWLPDGFGYTAFDSNLGKTATPAERTLAMKALDWVRELGHAGKHAPVSADEWLAEANGFVDDGHYDAALAIYNRILNHDPNNMAAFRRREEVRAIHRLYAEEHYSMPDGNMEVDTSDIHAGKRKEIENKLTRIIIPKLEFREVSIQEAIEFLKHKVGEIDTMESDPNRKGVNITLQLESVPGPANNAAVQTPPPIAPEESKITLSVSDVPLGEALKYITNLAGFKYKIDENGVTIVPLDSDMYTLVTKAYSVPTGFVNDNPRASLENAGVQFPPEAYARLVASGKILIVCNTPSNLDVVDAILNASTNGGQGVQAAQSPPPANKSAGDLLSEARGFFETGRYDLAYKRYEQVLQIDPYNIAARRGEAEVNTMRERYADQTAGDTHSYLNWKVTQGWDWPARKYQGHETVRMDTNAVNVRSTDAIQNKLNNIIIPKMEFRDATLREAVDFLKQKSRECDTTESDPNRRGISIILKLDVTQGLTTQPAQPGIPGLPADAAQNQAPTGNPPAVSPGEARITLSLTNIPLAEALKYITNLAGMKYRIDPYGVTIVPLSEITDTLITKEYDVPPGFFSTAGATSGNRDATGAAQATIQKKEIAREALENAGIQFPPGASAQYLPGSNKLIVRNTEANLDVVDTMVEPLNNIEALPVPEVKSGLLPMKFDLEKAGRKFSFEGYYAAERVGFHYADWWSKSRWGWIWWVVGALIFFAAGRAKAWRKLVWGALALTFIPMCLAPSLTTMCNGLLVGWVTGFAIYLVATRFVFRTRVTPATHAAMEGVGA